MTTITVCIPPIVEALHVADRVAQQELVWNPVNSAQERFLEEFYGHRHLLRQYLTPDELQGWASTDAGYLNEILERRRFSMRFGQIPSDGIGLLAILEARLRFLVEGSHCMVVADDRKTVHAGVRIEKNGTSVVDQAFVPGFLVHTSKVGLISEVPLTNGDSMFLVVPEIQPKDDWEILDIIAKAEDTMKPAEYLGYTAIQFPQVLIKNDPSIAYLNGLHAEYSNGTYRITGAQQETIFALDTKGVLAKSAAGMMCVTVSVGSEPVERILIIDQEFIVYTRRKQVPFPIFAGHAGKECWREPGNLDDL
jgi:hypothetical protein